MPVQLVGPWRGARVAAVPEVKQRWFFVHVQKTGGTDLFTRIGGDPSIPLEHDRWFSEAEIYPNDTDGDVFTVAPQLSVDQLLLRWKERRDEIRIVLGHFPLCTVELLDAEFTTLTVLREPVERTLSFLRHHRRLTPADRDKPLEAIYDEPFRFESLLHNHMVKMFALTTEEMTDGMLTAVDFTPEWLERAKRGLESVDVVGLQEDFEGFCRELEARFGWPLGAPFYANRTTPVDVPQSFRDRIAADNALDVELYEFARDLVSR
jgi:hypothetical protein